eukprot:Gb_34778 [translate_table: standard]
MNDMRVVEVMLVLVLWVSEADKNHKCLSLFLRRSPHENNSGTEVEFRGGSGCLEKKSQCCSRTGQTMSAQCLDGRRYLIFDKNDCSGRITFHPAEDFSIAAFQSHDFPHAGPSAEAEVTVLLGIAALENAKVFRSGLSLQTPLEGPLSSSVLGHEDHDHQKNVPLADAESCNNCCSDMEDSDEIDALLASSGDEFISTADSVDDSENNNKIERIRKTFQRLKSMVGADWMDTEAVFDEAIHHIKALQQTQLSNVHEEPCEKSILDA